MFAFFLSVSYRFVCSQCGEGVGWWHSWYGIDSGTLFIAALGRGTTAHQELASTNHDFGQTHRRKSTQISQIVFVRLSTEGRKRIDYVRVGGAGWIHQENGQSTRDQGQYPTHHGRGTCQGIRWGAGGPQRSRRTVVGVSSIVAHIDFILHIAHCICASASNH